MHAKPPPAPPPPEWRRSEAIDLLLTRAPADRQLTPPSSTRSAPPTPACKCAGAGALIEHLAVAQAEQLIVISAFDVGDRKLATVPCSCAAGQELARRWRNLPREAEGVTLATLRTVPHARWVQARQAVAAFVANPRGWLILAGNYGTGKTRLVYAALNELAAIGRYGRYLTMPDLLDLLRDSIKSGLYADVLARAVEAPILALDELDKFRADTEWATDVLEKLFIRRYREAQYTGTILVYNRERADRLPGFLQSRVSDSHFQLIELDGPDLRPYAAQLDPWDRGEGRDA
mgnify:CR=1 FL=1